MWRRTGLRTALAVAALLALAAPVAWAGGWAVTTMDPLPSEGFEAGQTYRLGWTIRQHGDKPFAGATTEIRIVGSGGERHVFRGLPEGPTGHYAADVRFPTAGEWSWEVTQEPFASQRLGTVQVREAAPTFAPQAAAQPAAASPPAPEHLGLVLVALPVATVLACALFAWRLAVFARRPRPAPPAAHSRATAVS